MSLGYVFWVNLAHDLVEFFLSAAAIFYSVSVLFRKSLLKKSVTISPAITVYFGFVFFWSVTATTYFAYLIIFWRPSGGDYNAYILYFGGLLPGFFFNTSSIAETFLCIERCISLLFPLQYTTRYKIMFAVITFLGIFGFMGLCVYVNNYFGIIPTDPKTTCQFFSCMAGASNKYLYFARIGFNFVNIAFALLLALLIKKVIMNSKSANHMNRTVFILIMSTTIIELIPFLSAQAYVMITGEQLFQYIGPFSTTAICFNITLSAALYYKAFKKFAGNNSSIKLAATTHATTNTFHK